MVKNSHLKRKIEYLQASHGRDKFKTLIFEIIFTMV